MARANRLREYEVEIRPGQWQTMKLTPEYVEEHGDPKRVREVAGSTKAPANKAARPANKAG